MPLSADSVRLSCGSPEFQPNGSSVTIKVLRRVSCRDINRVNEEWFADMDAVRDKVGLQDSFTSLPSTTPGQVGFSTYVSATPHTYQVSLSLPTSLQD